MRTDDLPFVKLETLLHKRKKLLEKMEHARFILDECSGSLYDHEHWEAYYRRKDARLKKIMSKISRIFRDYTHAAIAKATGV